MTDAYVDTDVLIRLLTEDDLEKQRRAVLLFQRVERGELVLAAPDTVIADAVFVLSSKRLYAISRAEVASLLTPLVRMSGFHVRNRRALIAALTLYASTPRLDFGDALIIASMRQTNSETIYSHDRDFDAVSGIARQEP